MITKNHYYQKFTNIFILLILLLVLLITTTLSYGNNQNKPATNSEILFEQANTFYEKGLFLNAAEIYQNLIDSGYQSGNLYYNLGNVYFKQNKKGLSILYYEKAKCLIPNDLNLRTNLNYALAGVDEGEIDWKIELTRSLALLIPLDQLTVFSSIFLFFLIILIIIPILSPTKIRDKSSSKINNWWKSLLSLSICLIVISFSLTTLTYIDHYQKQAVTVQAGAVAYFEPDLKTTVSFELAEGSRVYLNETKDGWCLIKRLDGKRGWVRHSYLREI